MVRSPAIVPDVFLSVDVEIAPDWWKKEHRSYFLWEFGKSLDVVIEIVSNTEGGEDDEKKRKYERMRVQYYVIYDPLRQVMKEPLTVYQLRGYSYVMQPEPRFPELKLGLTLWEGEYEGKHDTWLRWTDEHGQIIPTGKERAERERMEKEAALRQLEQERQRAARLAERLRQLGHDPDQE